MTILSNEKKRTNRQFYQMEQDIMTLLFRELEHNELRLMIVLIGNANNFVLRPTIITRLSNLTLDECNNAFKSLIEKGFLSKEIDIADNTIITIMYEYIYSMIESSKYKNILL